MTFADETLLCMIMNQTMTFFALTWCDDGWYGSALHIVLHSDNADVVLHSWNEAVQGAGVLACLHKLLHTVSLLPVGGSARHFVAGDILETESQRWRIKFQCV